MNLLPFKNQDETQVQLLVLIDPVELGRIIEDDLIEDKINLTFVWGPIAGYYAKQIKDHELVVIPMRNELRIPFEYQISMAVRYGEKAWKEQVNQLIEDNQDEINQILDDFGVPRLPIVVREVSGGDDDD